MSALSQAARLDRYWTEWLGERAFMRDSQTLRTQYRVSDFVTWQREGALELNPNFQRRPVWKKGAKSYLVDTILRGLPVPIIFLRDLPSDLRTLKAKRDVVDGQQRIRTLLSFIDQDLLSDFQAERDEFKILPSHNKDFGGKTFAQLDRDARQRILDYQFSVHSFPADTDDREILQIFARMNSTGVKLNAQELRNAEFFGLFKTLAYSIATEQLNRWRDWGIFTPEQIARMNEVELSSEFMLLIMGGILEKKNQTIGKFYGDFDEVFPDEGEVASRFRTVFDTIDGLFTKEQLAELFARRTLFYALFAALYGLQFGIRRDYDPSEPYKPLTHQRPKTVRADVVERILRGARAIREDRAPKDILLAMRGATTDASQRREIIGYLVGA
jgi:hypothetical protein